MQSYDFSSGKTIRREHSILKLEHSGGKNKGQPQMDCPYLSVSIFWHKFYKMIFVMC